MGTNNTRLDGLLEHRGWLKELARGLARDEAGADDLVQSTWALALERAPRGLRSPKAWLAQVLQNQARKRGRSETARRRRERSLARAEAGADSSELVAATELHRELGAEVLALAEPYRSTLLLHYFEGLSAHAIARRTGEPASTVRTRLARGLDQLRARLDQREGGRERWMSALGPILLAADGSRRVGLLAGTCALVLVGVGSWSALRAPGSSAPQPSLDTGIELTQLDADLQSPTTALLEVPEETRAPAAERAQASPSAQPNVPVEPTEQPSADAPLPIGVVELLVLRDEQPVTSGRALLSDIAGTGMSITLAPGSGAGPECTLDRTGIARFEGVEPGRKTLTLAVDPGHARQVLLEVPDSEGVRILIRLGHGQVVGRAYQEDGLPLVGAVVSWSSRMSRDAGYCSLVRTQVDGSYQLNHLMSGPSWLSLRGPGSGTNNDMVRIDVPEHGSVVHDFGDAGGMRTVTCRLVTSSGQPAVGSYKLSMTREPRRVFRQRSVNASEGVFDLRLEPGSWTVRIDDGQRPGRRLDIGQFEVDRQDLALDLTLPGVCLSGTLTGLGSEQPLRTLVSIEVCTPQDDYCLWRADWIDDNSWALECVGAGDWELVVRGRNGTLLRTPIQVAETDQRYDLTIPQ